MLGFRAQGLGVLGVLRMDNDDDDDGHGDDFADGDAEDRDDCGDGANRVVDVDGSDIVMRIAVATFPHEPRTELVVPRAPEPLTGGQPFSGPHETNGWGGSGLRAMVASFLSVAILALSLSFNNRAQKVQACRKYVPYVRPQTLKVLPSMGTSAEIRCSSLARTTSPISW